MQKSYLALGCFWRPEDIFRQISGVIETEVGYAGGESSNTSYEEVCTGKTGHTETVKIIYDEVEQIGVPESAITTQGKTAFIYKVVDNTAEKVNVIIGKRNFGKFQFYLEF